MLYKNNMDTRLWGPIFWMTLHTVSFNYPETPTYLEKRHHYDFFNTIQYILPCTVCREHYQRNFKQYPLETYLDTKKTLIQWVIMIHNEVNNANKKEVIPLPAILKTFESIYGNITKTTNLQERYARMIEYLFPNYMTCDCQRQSSTRFSNPVYKGIIILTIIIICALLAYVCM